MEEQKKSSSSPKKITRETISKHMLEYQLEIAGKTMLDVLDDDKWRFNITLTRHQQEMFKTYAIKLIKKIFKCNKTKAEQNFDWFSQQFGLRIKN